MCECQTTVNITLQQTYDDVKKSRPLISVNICGPTLPLLHTNHSMISNNYSFTTGRRKEHQPVQGSQGTQIHMWAKGRVFRHVCKIAKSHYQLCHVCPSVHMDQLGCHWMDFNEICYLLFFLRKSVEKIQVLLKSNKNNEYFTRRQYAFFIIFPSVLLKMRKM